MLGKVLCTVLYAGIAILGAPSLFIVALMRSQQFAALPYDGSVSTFNQAVADWVDGGSAAFKGTVNYMISGVASGSAYHINEVDGVADPPFQAQTEAGYPSPQTFDAHSFAAKYVFNNTGLNPLFASVVYSGSPLTVSAVLRGPGGPYMITSPAVFPASYQAPCIHEGGSSSQDDDHHETCSCPVGSLSQDGTRCNVRARLTRYCLNIDVLTHLPAYANSSTPGCSALPVLPDGSILTVPPTGNCLKSNVGRLSPFGYRIENDVAGPVNVAFSDFSVELRSAGDPYSVGLALTQGTLDFGEAPGKTYRAAVICWVGFGMALTCLVALLLCVYTSFFDACVEGRKALRHSARTVRAQRKRMQLEAAAAAAIASATNDEGALVPADPSRRQSLSIGNTGKFLRPSLDSAGPSTSSMVRVSNRYHLLRHPLLRDVSYAEMGMSFAGPSSSGGGVGAGLQFAPLPEGGSEGTSQSASTDTASVTAAALTGDGFAGAAADLAASGALSGAGSRSVQGIRRFSRAGLSPSTASIGAVPSSTVAIISSSGRSLLAEEEGTGAAGPARTRGSISMSMGSAAALGISRQGTRLTRGPSAVSSAMLPQLNNRGTSFSALGAASSSYPSDAAGDSGNRGPSASFVVIGDACPAIRDELGYGYDDPNNGTSMVGVGGGFVVTDEEWASILAKAPPPQGVPLDHWESMTLEEREIAFSDDLYRSNWHWGALGVASASSIPFWGWGGGGGAGSSMLHLWSCFNGRCNCRIPLFCAVVAVSFLSWLAFMQSSFRGCCPRMPNVTRRQTIASAKVVAAAAAIISAVLGGVFLGSPSSSIQTNDPGNGNGGNTPAPPALDPSGPSNWICAYNAVCGSLASQPDSCASISQAAAIDLLPQLTVIRGLVIAGIAMPLLAIFLSTVFVDRGLYATENKARRNASVLFAVVCSVGVLLHWVAQGIYYLQDTADGGSVAFCGLASNANAVSCLINDKTEEIFQASTGVSVLTAMAMWLAVGLFLSGDDEQATAGIVATSSSPYPSSAAALTATSMTPTQGGNGGDYRALDGGGSSSSSYSAASTPAMAAKLTSESRLEDVSSVNLLVVNDNTYGPNGSSASATAIVASAPSANSSFFLPSPETPSSASASASASASRQAMPSEQARASSASASASASASVSEADLLGLGSPEAKA